MRIAGRTVLAAALALACAGCVTRGVVEPVFDKDRIQVKLRGHKRGTKTIEKGYEHPLTISEVRAAHILSRIDLRKDEKKGPMRVPAIPTEMIYTMGEGLSKAFAQADSTQEIVVMAVRREKRLGIFDRKFLTTFVAYREQDQVHIHLNMVDWEIPLYREDRLPEPQIDYETSKFRVIPTAAMTPTSPTAVAVEWRNPIFAKATRTQITPGGRVVRRTILMESPEEAPDQAPAPLPAMPDHLAPETLRKLADLEDARRRGDLSETEYTAERRRILAADPGVQGNNSPERATH
jgi:hypothetical protein